MDQETGKSSRPKWVVLLIGLAAVMVITGVALWRYTAHQEYIDGNVLNLPYINQWNEENRLDNPWKNASFQMTLLYRTLFMTDSSFQSTDLDLASGYEVSKDGLNYEISLKEGITWSDGTPITMDDVVFSIESVLQSKTANGIYTAAFSKIKGFKRFVKVPDEGLAGLERVDDDTIVIHLSSPHPTMMKVLAQFVILPAHCFQNVDIPTMDTADYWKKPVVSGMYQVGEVVPYETVQLVRNPEYSGTLPQIDEVVLHVDYKFTNLDYYSTNNITEIINYRSMRSMNEHKVDLLFYRYFIFNVEGVDGNQNPAMQDANVRKAIAMAIDRESLLYDIYLDSGTLVDTGVPRTFEAYDGEELTYDPEGAQTLLASTDYDMSRPLRLAYYYTDTVTKTFMEAVAEDLRAVGFQVEVKYLSSNEELYGVRAYDLMLKGLSAFDVSEWYFEYADENANLSRVFGGHSDFDSVVDELSTTVDSDKENQLLKTLQEMERETMFKIPLFTLGQVVYINEDRVKLPTNCSFGNTWYRYDVDFANWSIRKD